MNLGRTKWLKSKYFIIGCVVLFAVIGIAFAMIVSKADATAGVQYRAHVAYNGWLGWQTDGGTAGTIGESRRMEALKIKLTGSMSGSVKYSTYLRDSGWQGEVKDGATGGTEGQSRQIEAIKISLEGDVAKSYDITYRVHMKYYGWQSWVSNGAVAGSETEKLRIEAIEIKLVKKAEVQNNVPETSTSTTISEADMRLFVCLVFCESGSESYEGKLGVANVVLNRYHSSKYPNTIKGVIYQSGQFSPTWNGSLNKNLALYDKGGFTGKNHLESIQAVKDALNGKNNVGSRLYFNGYNYEKNRGHKNAMRIGNHLFW